MPADFAAALPCGGACPARHWLPLPLWKTQWGACPRAAPAIPAAVENAMGAEPARHWLSLPLWCLKGGACLLCRPPTPPLALFLPPSPRPPSPPGKGEFFSLFCRGLRPRHPGIIATSKIAVTLDNYSKKWYNMSQGNEKNG